MKVLPKGDWLLVRPDATREEVRGSLVVPGSVMESELRGTVLEAGPGMVTIQGDISPNPFKPGDRVFLGPVVTEGITITVDGVECLLIPAGRIPAALEGEDA